VFVTGAGDDRSPLARFRRFARRLYGGRNPHSRMFLYALLIFDSASLLFIIATSFLSRALDLAFGLSFLAELVLRLAGVRSVVREFLRITTWTDIVAITSCLRQPRVKPEDFCACCARCGC
jgi:voltage-gated potassium channel